MAPLLRLPSPRRPRPGLAAAAVGLLLCAAPAGHAQDAPPAPSPTEEAATPAEDLLEQLGVRARPAPGVQKLLDQYSKAHPQVPHDFWRALYEYHAHPGRLRGALGKIVERDMSSGEIDEALAFFASDVGQKVVAIRVTLAEESKDVARQMANEFRQDVRARLKKAGYLE